MEEQGTGEVLRGIEVSLVDPGSAVLWGVEDVGLEIWSKRG